MITSLTNAKVKYVRRLQSEKRFRLREQAFVVEGTRWLTEFSKGSLMPPHLPQQIFYTADWQQVTDHASILQHLPSPSQLVSSQVMAAMSQTQTPPGVLAVVPMQARPLPQQPSLLLVLDEVTNPGNMGTILRSAGAAGVDGVILMPGCVDVYNPKTVRSGMGVHLRLPIHQAQWEQAAELLADLAVWVAAADGETPYTAVNWQFPSAVIMGNEAHGTSQPATTLAKGRLSIPMHRQTESLNVAVAASIILFEAMRQRTNRDSPC